MSAPADAMSAGAGSVLRTQEGGVAWITLNRPARLNAFAGEMRDRLADAIAESAADPETRVIVITGAGRAFSAGADVDVMTDLLARDDHETFAGLVRAGTRVVREIRAARQPVIAAVNGVAAGAGASLAVACDLRIASEAASIGFTFNRIGLHPDWGATFFLPRLVGNGRAGELIYTARILSATEAGELGIFERVVPGATFEREVAELAAELAAKPPLALSLAKQSLNDAAQRDALEEALRQESAAQVVCFRSRDVREGIAAFREKRVPDFRGE